MEGRRRGPRSGAPKIPFGLSITRVAAGEDAGPSHEPCHVWLLRILADDSVPQRVKLTKLRLRAGASRHSVFCFFPSFLHLPF